MWLWHSKGWDVKGTWALPQVKRIVWVAVALLVLWAIVVAAPGNYARMNAGEEFAHPLGILGWLKAMTKAVVLFFWFMVFIFLITWLLLPLPIIWGVNPMFNCQPLR